MFPPPYWAIECLDGEEAAELLLAAPEGSFIEETGVLDGGILIILWVPVPDDVLAAELGGTDDPRSIPQ